MEVDVQALWVMFAGSAIIPMLTALSVKADSNTDAHKLVALGASVLLGVIDVTLGGEWSAEALAEGGLSAFSALGGSFLLYQYFFSTDKININKRFKPDSGLKVEKKPEQTYMRFER